METKPSSQTASISDNMFAGLTFPEVPKTLKKSNMQVEEKHIDIKRESNYIKNTLKEDNINIVKEEDEGSVITDDEEENVIINEEVDLPSYESLNSKQPTTITFLNEIETNSDIYPEVIPQIQTAPPSVNFTKLYNSESDYAVSSKNIYPDLDSIETPTPANMIPLHHQYHETNTINHTEQHPYLYPTVYSNPHKSSNQPSVLSSLSTSLSSVIDRATSYTGLGNNTYRGYSQLLTHQEESRDIEMENYVQPQPSIHNDYGINTTTNNNANNINNNNNNNNNVIQNYSNANVPSIVYNQVDSTTDSRLVSELLSENDRLTRDNLNLRNTIQQMNNNNFQSTTQPSKGILVSVDQIHSRNQVHDDDSKYVCCGSCRQWNKVAKLANLVQCGGCNVVNDCVNASSQSNLYRIQNNSTSPYFNFFGDCFK
jgi:hypothetical protein